MKTVQVYKEDFSEILTITECPDKLNCFDTGTDNLCKVRVIKDNFVECLDKKARTCNYHFNFGFGYFCRCPLRIYLARSLN